MTCSQECNVFRINHFALTSMHPISQPVYAQASRQCHSLSYLLQLGDYVPSMHPVSPDQAAALAPKSARTARPVFGPNRPPLHRDMYFECVLPSHIARMPPVASSRLTAAARTTFREERTRGRHTILYHKEPQFAVSPLRSFLQGYLHIQRLPVLTAECQQPVSESECQE